MNKFFLFSRKLICISTLFVVLHVHAQSTNALAFPSANNAFLGAVGSTSAATGIGVDLYTGTAVVNIPIFNLPSKDLSIPISLTYIGGRGVRVQDYAGSVGLGWMLNAGGNISRVVRCFPDEQPNGYLGTGQWGQVVASNLANNTAVSNSAITGINGTSFGAPTADGEPDIYSVKTPFFNFQFTFDENGNPVFSNSTGLKIITTNFYNSSNYNNSSFEVIDDQGTQYYFGSSSASVETSTTTLFGNTYTFPTTWYLDKIVTFNTKEVVLLSYTTTASSDVVTHYQSSTSYDIYGAVVTDNTPVQTTINQPKAISKIYTYNGEADFYYANDRRDDASAPRLSSIVLNGFTISAQMDNNYLQTYYFNYGYFGDPSSDPNVLRLRLDNITVAGNSATTPLSTYRSFTYNTSAVLPSRQALSAVDYWGYNTAPASNPYNQPLPPNGSYAIAGVLTGITDIAGSSYLISYESNSYYDNTGGVNVSAGGLRVSQIAHSLATGDNIVTGYQYVDNNNHSTGQIISTSYLINSVSLFCGVTRTFSESPSDFYDLNGNFIGYSSVKVVDATQGYAVYKFSNFSDANCNDIFNYTGNTTGMPDITSSISASYKRGLLLDYAIYNSAGNTLSEDFTPLSAYASLTSPILKKAWAYRWGVISGGTNNVSCSQSASSTYYTNVENFRLTEKIHKDFDQANPSTFAQTTIDYTYLTNSTVAFNDDHRLVKTISTKTSKSDPVVNTFYYASDMNTSDGSGIPMLTGTDQQSIFNMLSTHKTAALIHETDQKNNVLHDLHNSYNVFNIGANYKTFLTTVSKYTPSATGNVLIGQQNFNYDWANANLIASWETNGKPTAYLYDYGGALQVAKVINATSVSSATGNNNEFFYESFETIGNVFTSPHGGSSSYSGTYNVPFTIPNGRQYVIQWWSYVSSSWVFHEQPYTGSLTLSGQIDDVRIFPSDAQMIVCSYLPMVGKSSQIDPAGKSEYYQYDGFGRKSLILDNDLNIVKAFDYGYQQPGYIPQYNVYLTNNSQYPANIVHATIDGVSYNFPGQQLTTTVPVTLTAGNHSLSLAYGPSSSYTVNGICYSAAQTNPAINFNVQSNLNITYVNSCLITNSVACNLTSDAAHTTACSCHGCQYTNTIYYLGSLGVGTQLYLDAALTQQVTGKTWCMPYSGNVVWPLSSTGVITGASQNCP